MSMMRGRCGGMGNMSDEQNSGMKMNEALEILKIRYAKGEITREEYEKMKEEILK